MNMKQRFFFSLLRGSKKMPSGSKSGLIVLRICGIALSFIALIFVAAALFSNCWEEATIGSDENAEIHVHGLWEYCRYSLHERSNLLCLNIHYWRQPYRMDYTSGIYDKDTEIHSGQGSVLDLFVLLDLSLLSIIIVMYYHYYLLRTVKNNY